MKTLSLAIFVVLIITSILNADTAKSNPQTTKSTPEAEKTEKVKGKVKKIDLVKHTLKVKIGEKEQVYTFGSETRFVKQDKSVKGEKEQPVEPSTIKVGDKVAVTYDSKNFARKIKIESKSGHE